MPRKRRRKRKKRFDVEIKSKPKPKLIRRLHYSYTVAEIDGRITLTVANNKGATFMLIYRGVDSVHDTRDRKSHDFKTVESELKRLLGDDLGIIAHKDAVFRMGVMSW